MKNNTKYNKQLLFEMMEKINPDFKLNEEIKNLDYIVVLPYEETSRLFHASKTTKQEAYLGEDNTIVYYEYKAKSFTKEEAEKIAKSHENTEAFVRKK